MIRTGPRSGPDGATAPRAKRVSQASVARGESLTITRHGKPVARLVPVTGNRERARAAAARIVERRRHLKRVPLADLLATIHEEHRY